MVDFPGHLPAGLLYGASVLTVAPGDHLRVEEVEDAYASAPSAAGATAILVPVSILHTGLPGAFSYSYFFDFYHRIWLIPNVVDFGAISEDSEIGVLLWNAWFVQVDLDSIVVTDADGVTIEGPAPPKTYKPLSLTEYTVHASYAGGPSFFGKGVFSFLNDEVRELTISGVRAFLWDTAYWPNWRDPVTVTHEFKTEIITSRSGLEQRRSLRETPRKRVEFVATIANTDVRDALRQFRRYMERGQNKTAVMPEFPRRVGVTEAPTSGSDLVQLESVPAWLVENRSVVLHDSRGSSLYRVLHVSGTTLQLAQKLTRDWGSDTSVVAGLTGRLPDALPTTDRASFVTEVSVRFDAYVGAEVDEAFDAGDPVIEFDGREIFPWRPDWSFDPNVDMQWPIEEVDFEFGLTERFRIVEFPARMFKAQFLASTSAAAEAMLRFFLRAKGRRGEFFIPTFENDLRLRQPTPIGSNVIRLVGLEPLRTYTDSPVHKVLLVRQRDGSYHPFKVVLVSQVNDSLGEDTLIELTEVSPIVIGGPDTSTIDWMYLARLGSDSLTFSWVRSDVARVQISFQTLPYAEAE
jgi:hypothetical protein